MVGGALRAVWLRAGCAPAGQLPFLACPRKGNPKERHPGRRSPVGRLPSVAHRPGRCVETRAIRLRGHALRQQRTDCPRSGSATQRLSGAPKAKPPEAEIEPAQCSAVETQSQQFEGNAMALRLFAFRGPCEPPSSAAKPGAVGGLMSERVAAQRIARVRDRRPDRRATQGSPKDRRTGCPSLGLLSLGQARESD
jgi:hypothetical protein